MKLIANTFLIIFGSLFFLFFLASAINGDLIRGVISLSLGVLFAVLLLLVNTGKFGK